MLRCPKCRHEPLEPQLICDGELQIDHADDSKDGTGVIIQVCGTIFLICHECESRVATCYIDCSFNATKQMVPFAGPGVPPEEPDERGTWDFEMDQMVPKYRKMASFPHSHGWNHVSLVVKGKYTNGKVYAAFNETIRIPAYHFHRIYGL